LTVAVTLNSICLPVSLLFLGREMDHELPNQGVEPELDIGKRGNPCNIKQGENGEWKTACASARLDPLPVDIKLF